MRRRPARAQLVAAACPASSPASGDAGRPTSAASAAPERRAISSTLPIATRAAATMSPSQSRLTATPAIGYSPDPRTVRRSYVERLLWGAGTEIPTTSPSRAARNSSTEQVRRSPRARGLDRRLGRDQCRHDVGGREGRRAQVPAERGNVPNGAIGGERRCSGQCAEGAAAARERRRSSMRHARAEPYRVAVLHLEQLVEILQRDVARLQPLAAGGRAHDPRAAGECRAVVSQLRELPHGVVHRRRPVELPDSRRPPTRTRAGSASRACSSVT